jgi:hypothetical protein
LEGCDKNLVLANEVEAAFYAVEHFNELPLRGFLLRVDSEVGAISLFERLNADTALIHFEKGLPDCEGIYKAINAETAAALAGEVEYINRESDLGVGGLREAKMRYHPHHMVEVYSLNNPSCATRIAIREPAVCFASRVSIREHEVCFASLKQTNLKEK